MERSRGVRAPNGGRRTRAKVLIAVLAGFVFVGACDQPPPPLPSGYHLYADHEMTPRGKELRTGAMVPGLRGGRVGMHGVGIEINLVVRSFLDAPGFVLYGLSSGIAPGYVNDLHPKVTAFNGCRWGFVKDIGNAPLTCYYLT